MTNPPKPVLSSEAQIANSAAKQLQERLCYLYGRWQDEKEYEDWADYEKAMRDAAARVDGIKVIKISKRPFGFQFSVNEKGVFQIGVTARSYYLKRIR
jgi:uncharacterized phage protein gp47/JayE